MQLGVKSFSLPEGGGYLSKGQFSTFLVSCDGRCKDVNIFLYSEEGDFDLFGLERATPVIKDKQCKECKSFCSSRSESQDSCRNLKTSNQFLPGNTFHVMAFSYKGGRFRITFENIDDVVEYGN